MDWEDEDEATTVFGREEAAAAFLRVPGPAAGTPAFPPVASRSGAPTVISLLGGGKPAARPPAPPAPPAPPVAAAPALVFAPIQPPAGSKSLIILAGVTVVILLAAVTGFFTYISTRPGSLLVTVAGPRGKKLDAVEIYVDKQLRCDASPCQVLELSRGNHTVYASAPGYSTLAERPIAVEPRKESTVELSLSTEAGTGISVATDTPGLTLFVDGQKIGSLPQSLGDMTPGEHKVRIESEKNENYELAPFEQLITVQADKVTKLDPKLRVLMGQVKIEEGENASKASVLLVLNSERRRVPLLPANLKLIDASKGYSIVATRDGHEDYREDIKFDDGQPVRTFTVSLRKKGAESAAVAPGPATPRTPAAVGTPVAVRTPAAATGGSRLNFNSIPVSSVILDGRPLGSTPRMGVAVAAGTHTVVFVHAQFGRKVQTVTVEAGETKTAAVRFQ